MSVPLESTTVMSMLVVLMLLVASTAHVTLDTEAMAPVVRVSEHMEAKETSKTLLSCSKSIFVIILCDHFCEKEEPDAK